MKLGWYLNILLFNPLRTRWTRQESFVLLKLWLGSWGLLNISQPVSVRVTNKPNHGWDLCPLESILIRTAFGFRCHKPT
jgi:hypothetical protein